MRLSIAKENEMKDNYSELLHIIKSELVLTMGCTEPGVTAFGAAAAAQLLDGRVSSLKIRVSNGIYKNGAMTLIPGTGLRGLKVAAALGAVIARPEKELMILINVDAEQLEQMHALLRNNAVEVESAGKGCEPIFVEALAYDNSGNSARAIISGGHNNLILLEKNNKVIMKKDMVSENQEHNIFNRLSMDDVIEFAQDVPLEELEFIHESIEVNSRIAHYGITHAKGLGIGNAMKKIIESGIYSDDLIHYACMLTTAAVDVRMGGYNMPAMACGGSGNQGILATIPILAVAHKKNIDEVKLLRSLAMSYIVTIYAKQYLGKLSVLCGCSATAGIGCTAGITYLMGGDKNQIKSAMSNFFASLSGMICDGAKEGCSLKVMHAVFGSIQSALFAMQGKTASQKNGIIGETQEETILNLRNLSQLGMGEVDTVIIGILRNKLQGE